MGKVVMEVGIKGILHNTMQATKMVKMISTKMGAVAVVNLNFSAQCRKKKNRKTSHLLVACL